MCQARSIGRLAVVDTSAVLYCLQLGFCLLAACNQQCIRERKIADSCQAVPAVHLLSFFSFQV